MKTQLIPVAHTQPLPVYPSVFADFVASLLKRESSASRKSMHAGRWVTWPYERLLVDGSWMLLSVTANKYNKSVGTPDEVRQVASLCNRMFSTGLLLRYQSPVKATIAFERQVIGALNLAVSLGYRPGMILSNPAWRGLMAGSTQLAVTELNGKVAPAVGSLSAFWGLPAYLFMADCFKAARVLGETLKERCVHFRSLNLITRIPSKDPDADKYDLHMRAHYFTDHRLGNHLDYLDPLSKSDWGDGYSPWLTKSALQLTAEMDLAELRLSTMRAVPINFVSTNRIMLYRRHRYIAQMWIDARIVQSIGGKEKELYGYDIGPSHEKKMVRLGRERIVQLVVDLALSRGTHWNAQQLQCFRELVAERFDYATSPR